jgi:hypothetical protein
VYVVDDQDILLGRVSLKKIILSKSDTLIRDIYEKEIVFIESYRDQNEVAEIMQRYDLESVPVVNFQGMLLGRITIDDVVDVITEQAEEEINLMSGISETVEEDEPVWTAAKARLPWLLIGMCGGLLGAKLAGLFEWQIRMVPAMAFFIPLITATGGNVGIQASTVMVQGLSNRLPGGMSFLQKLMKTVAVDCLLNFDDNNDGTFKCLNLGDSIGSFAYHPDLQKDIQETEAAFRLEGVTVKPLPMKMAIVAAPVAAQVAAPVAAQVAAPVAEKPRLKKFTYRKQEYRAIQKIDEATKTVIGYVVYDINDLYGDSPPIGFVKSNPKGIPAGNIGPVP